MRSGPWLKRFPALLPALVVAISACLPGGKIAVGAARLPKTTTEATAGETAASAIPAETIVVTRAPGMDIGWPAPFTYGEPTPPPTPIPPPVSPFTFESDVVNILLLGSDQRSPTGSFRTDVLILLSIHPRQRAAAMISIPRDLYLYLPGYSMQRINTAFQLGEQIGYPGGGASMLADTVRYNLGVQVHHFARVDMDGFRRIIDTLGGVDVHVACSYQDWRLRDPSLTPRLAENWRLFTVPSGVVHMDGDYALWYARSRLRSSDFDRSRRQHEVLRAAYRQILSLDLIPQLPSLFAELRETVTTDMDLGDLLALAPLAARIDPSRIHNRFIGRDEVLSWRIPTSGAQVLVPKPDRIRALLEDAFRFEEADELVPEVAITIEVINSTNHASWPTLAAERLNYAGFEAYIGNATVDPGPTHLLDYGLAPAEDAERVLSALGLSPARLVHLADPSSPFPFRLVLGEDYNPCFNPARDQLP